MLDPVFKSLLSMRKVTWNGVNSVIIFSTDGNFILNANENNSIMWRILEITEIKMENMVK